MSSSSRINLLDRIINIESPKKKRPKKKPTIVISNVRAFKEADRYCLEWTGYKFSINEVIGCSKKTWMGVKTKFKNLASPFAEKFKPILLEKYILVLRWNHRYDRINVGLMYKVFEDFLKNDF